jgi:transcriptional regulator with XRE-family HTH domain
MFESGILANIIRRHRKLSGLSHLQLADLAGVGKTVIYDIETGKISLKLDTLSKILKILNIKVTLKSPVMDQILRETNEKS